MEIAIIGAGVTKFGHHWDKDHDDLLAEAVSEALADANLEMKDIEAVWCGTFLSVHWNKWKRVQRLAEVLRQTNK